MARNYARILTLLSLLAASGCDLIDSKICTDNLVSGIVLYIIDEPTDGAVTSFYAEVVDGDYIDSYQVGDTTIFTSPIFRSHRAPSASLAVERPGTYQINIQSAGYESWQQSNVRVEMGKDGCHVVPVEVAAILKRSP